MEQDEARLLLIIDRDPAQARAVANHASRDGWRTVCVDECEAAIATLGTQEGMQLTAIVLDQSVPGEEACDLIAEMKSRRPALPILMLTASTSPQLAVEAMRAGATDYLVKPVGPEKVMQAVAGATRRGSPQNELAPLAEKIKSGRDFDAMVGAIESRFCADPDRRFATGYSSGAFMSHRLACVRGDVLRGVATIGGGQGGRDCSGIVGALLIHDQDDGTVRIRASETMLHRSPSR